MSATRSASFNHNYRAQSGVESRSGPVRRSESLPVNASARKPNRVDTGVSTSGLRDFVKKGTLPPHFTSVIYRARPFTSMVQVSHCNGDPEKLIAESRAELSPLEISDNANLNDAFSPSTGMFTKEIQGHDEAENPISAGNVMSRRETVASATPVGLMDERVSLSRTSRHSRRLSIPKPILRGPGRSLPDVGTANITVHAQAHETIEESVSRTFNGNDSDVAFTENAYQEVRQTSVTVEEVPPLATFSNDDVFTQNARQEVRQTSCTVEDVPPNDTLPVNPDNEDVVEVEVDADFDSAIYEDAMDEGIVEEADESDALAELTENVHAINLNGTLAPSIIAHDRDAVTRMNSWNIAWGVQYEIARGVSQKLWSWEDVTNERLQMLQGSNLDKAPLVTDVFGKGPGTVEAFRQAEKIFGELDREQKARIENTGRGLGLRGPWEGVENWYGGRIQQVARLRKVPGRQGFSITLDKMQTGKSNRVTRFVGSRSILQIRMEEKLVQSQGDNLITFLARRQVICGRIFYPFYAKENKVYLVECNEDLDRNPSVAEGDQFRLSWDEFISWHNPLDLNLQQPISKWSTRWALVLSTTKPVIEFDPQNVFFIDDIYATREQHGVEEIMTDGCGLMNWTAFMMIGFAMKLQISPLAVQGRLAGSKGLWILHPDPKHRETSEPPKIWIRKSQNKIRLPPLKDIHRSHRILDMVRLPRLTLPSSINKQTITNLSSNGVPDSAIMQLLADNLFSEIEPLTNWTGPNAFIHLGKAVENAGRIAGGRRGRQAGLEGRAFTLNRQETDDDNDELRDGVNQGGLVDRYMSSGCPTDLYEVTREMLLAGFSPLTLPALRDKIKKIIEMVTKRYVNQYRISVPNSVEAFIAPDPLGVLEEGEIFFRSTEPFGDKLSVDPTTFTGHVLVMRNPTMVASDIQKVKAVTRNELLPYVNVILFSTKGPQSLASYLGGGDYDGDTVTILAERSIVDAFKDPKTVREPKDLRDNFQPEIEKVSAFCDRVRSMDGASHAYELAKKLLSGLSDSKVGMYSRFHENFVYSDGYSHPEAVRLAYMFTTCLDSTKSGLKLKDDVFVEDRDRYSDPQPRYAQSKDESDTSKAKSEPRFVRHRPPELGPFILDALQDKGKELQNGVLAKYNKLCNSQGDSHDIILLAPYKKTIDILEDPGNRSSLKFLSEELGLLRAHVQDMLKKYKEELQAYDRWKRSSGSREGAVSRRGLVQNLIIEFWSLLPKLKRSKVLSKPEEYMASYAYWYSVHGKERDSPYAKEFAFIVAFKKLCAIKAAASSRGEVTITEEVADFLLLSGPLVKSSVTAVE